MIPTVYGFDKLMNSASDCVVVRMHNSEKRHVERDLAWEVMSGLLGRGEELLAYAAGPGRLAEGPVPLGRTDTIVTVGLTRTRMLVVSLRRDTMHFEIIPIDRIVTVTEEVSRQQFGASVDTVYRTVIIRVEDHPPVELQTAGESDAEQALEGMVEVLHRLLNASTCVHLHKRVFC